MRSALKAVGVVAALGMATAITVGMSGLALVAYLFGTCSGPEGGTHPADDSPQGQLCGRSDLASGLEDLAVWAIPAAGATALAVLAFAWWRGGSRLRSVASVLLVVAPFLPLALLSLPPDACTAEVRARPGSECSTGGDPESGPVVESVGAAP